MAEEAGAVQEALEGDAGGGAMEALEGCFVGGGEGNFDEVGFGGGAADFGEVEEGTIGEEGSFWGAGLVEVAKDAAEVEVEGGLTGAGEGDDIFGTAV